MTTCTHTQSTNNNFSLFSSRQAVRKQTDGDRETKEKEEKIEKKPVDISQGVDYSLKKKSEGEALLPRRTLTQTIKERRDSGFQRPLQSSFIFTLFFVSLQGGSIAKLRDPTRA